VPIYRDVRVHGCTWELGNQGRPKHITTTKLRIQQTDEGNKCDVKQQFSLLVLPWWWNVMTTTL
jgi:hypothetical protein